jgi:hypothetical protein
MERGNREMLSRVKYSLQLYSIHLQSHDTCTDFDTDFPIRLGTL